MKSAANGGLNLSVLDGWWAEGYDGTNGWAIDGSARRARTSAQDARHAHALYDLLEQQVVPLFHDRDADGIPRALAEMVKRSLRTNGPRFSAARMVEEYAELDLSAGVARRRRGRSATSAVMTTRNAAQAQSTASNEPVTSRTAPRTKARSRRSCTRRRASARPARRCAHASARDRVAGSSRARTRHPGRSPRAAPRRNAAAGKATNPIAPRAKTLPTPTSHGRRPPYRSESHGIRNELGIAVSVMQASSSPADASLQPARRTRPRATRSGRSTPTPSRRRSRRAARPCGIAREVAVRASRAGRGPLRRARARPTPPR